MRFFLFLINGLVLGIFTFIAQYIVDNAIERFFIYHQLIASLLTISPFIFLNFYSQKKIIFKKRGSIIRFLASSIFIMILISLLTEMFSQHAIFNFHFMKKEINLNFIFAAGAIAPLSFYIKKNIVFKV